MASIRVAIDNIHGKSSDKKTLESFAENLRQAGHTVTTHGIGPNKIQRVMLSKSNSCDLMIQVAGGKCLGTLVDFYTGVKRGYYHAKGGGFAYFKCYDANWKAGRAGDDGFSSESSLKPYKGKTLPEIYATMKPYCFFGYGNTADELSKTFLASYTGKSSTSSTGEGGGGGGSILELIKQAISPLDHLGGELTLHGDTLEYKRTNPNNAYPLTPSNIINNSISITDYDNGVPTTYESYTDDYLAKRFGKVPLQLEEGQIADKQHQQILQIAQRGYNHSLSMKVILDIHYLAGNWVSLTLPQYGLKDRKYYISKCDYSEERVLNITLDPAPPSRYVEAQAEETTEETEEEATEETEE